MNRIVQARWTGAAEFALLRKHGLLEQPEWFIMQAVIFLIQLTTDIQLYGPSTKNRW